MTKTFGQEIMRVDFAKDDQVKDIKMEYAALYDKMIQRSQDMEKAADNVPSTLAVGNITEHMGVMMKAQETMRCAAEACKFLELACMFHVKALTA